MRIFSALMTTTWSPESRYGVKAGLSLPMRIRAARVARRPSTWSVASITNHWAPTLSASASTPLATYVLILAQSHLSPWRQTSILEQGLRRVNQIVDQPSLVQNSCRCEIHSELPSSSKRRKKQAARSVRPGPFEKICYEEQFVWKRSMRRFLVVFRTLELVLILSLPNCRHDSVFCNESIFLKIFSLLRCVSWNGKPVIHSIG